MKISLYCQYFCMSENVFVWRYSAYFFPCVMYTKSMYAIFVQRQLGKVYFVFKLSTVFKACIIIWKGGPGQSFLHYIVYSLEGTGWGWRGLNSNHTAQCTADDALHSEFKSSRILKNGENTSFESKYSN